MVGLQGRVVGGYRLGDQIGGGGIAEVYRAQPTIPAGREAVVKIIYPEFAQQPGFRAHFAQVVQNARRLSHPHILPVLESGEVHGHLYIITPYVADGTLRDWLRADRRLGGQDVGPFFRQLCEAIGYAHAMGVVHGNLKPGNIFLHEGRHVLVGDFGRLWDLSQMDMTHAGPGIEAVEYLAPEAIEGHIDQRGDIYSLGGVLFASLTGRAPFGGTTPFEVVSKHARQPVPHLTEMMPPVPPAVLPLDDVVQRAMAKAPAARFLSAAALDEAIENAVLVAASGPFAPMGNGPFRPGGSAGLPGQPPFGAPGVLGLSGLGAPASAFGPSVGPGLGQIPFPPLPGDGLVDPSMEEGRLGSMPLGPGGDAEALPTTALPAQQHVAGMPDLPAGALGAPPGPPGGWGAPAWPPPRLAPPPALDGMGGTYDPPPTVITPAQGPWPAAQPGAPSAAASTPATDGVVAPPDPPEQVGGSSPGAPEGVAAFVLQSGSSGGLAGSPSTSARGNRPFSATKLGLPRLTLPEMGDLPPSWREIASGSEPSGVLPPVSGNGRSAGAEVDRWGESEQQGSMSGSWGGSAEWGGASRSPGTQRYDEERWGESAADSRGYSAPSESYAASEWGRSRAERPPDSMDSLGAVSAAEAEVSYPARRRGRRAAPDERPRRRRGGRRSRGRDEAGQPDDPYAHAVTRAREAYHTPRRPRGRHNRPLLLFLLLLIMVDGLAAVVVRPDLCPHNSCAVLHARVHHYLSKVGLGSLVPDTASNVSPLSASTNPVTLQTHAGSSTTVTLTLANTAQSQSAWSTKSSLAWLSISPHSGALAPGASIETTVTAAPTSGVQPATYRTTIVFTSGTTTLTVTVVITVT